MRPPKPRRLTDLLVATARECLRTQRALDAQAVEARERFSQLIDALPAGTDPRTTRALLATVAPARQVIRSWEFKFAARLETRRSIGFEIKARPLNLGYSIERRRSASSATRFALTIEPVPFPLPPKTSAT
jgi:hypothetical protein